MDLTYVTGACYYSHKEIETILVPQAKPLLHSLTRYYCIKPARMEEVVRLRVKDGASVVSFKLLPSFHNPSTCASDELDFSATGLNGCVTSITDPWCNCSACNECIHFIKDNQRSARFEGERCGSKFDMSFYFADPKIPCNCPFFLEVEAYFSCTANKIRKVFCFKLFEDISDM